MCSCQGATIVDQIVNKAPVENYIPMVEELRIIIIVIICLEIHSYRYSCSLITTCAGSSG